jgi:hypothetical protein
MAVQMYAWKLQEARAQRARSHSNGNFCVSPQVNILDVFHAYRQGLQRQVILGSRHAGTHLCPITTVRALGIVSVLVKGRSSWPGTSFCSLLYSY